MSGDSVGCESPSPSSLSSSSSPSESPPPIIHPMTMEPSAFMRRSFHKNPRLPGTYRLSKLNGSSRNSYADSESENDLPDSLLSRDLESAFSRGTSSRQSCPSIRTSSSSLPPVKLFDRNENRRRAIIPISTRMAARVISNATGVMSMAHVDCRDFSQQTHLRGDHPAMINSHHRTPKIIEEQDEPPTFVTFKPTYGTRSSICSDDCSTSEGSTCSPHSTVRRAGTSSSPDLVKSSLNWLKDPSCRYSMSSQGSWFSDDELYSIRKS